MRSTMTWCWRWSAPRISIDADGSVRAAIITGEGEKSFCAGGDIEAWSALSPSDFGLAWVRHGHRAFDALARLRQPLIAALNGHTLGGGLELAATADFRIAEEHVKLGSPETGLGIIPGWSGTQRTVRRFGSQLVRRMALLGEVFTAEEGLRLGLVDEVAPQGQGLAAARAMAETHHEARAARHPGHQDADQRRRRRGGPAPARGPGRRPRRGQRRAEDRRRRLPREAHPGVLRAIVVQNNVIVIRMSRHLSRHSGVAASPA